MTDDMHAFGAEYVPTWGERVSRGLGFRGAYQQRPDETEEFPSYMVTSVRIGLSLLDRLRILLTGKIDVETVSQTDVEVRRVKSQSSVGVPWR